MKVFNRIVQVGQNYRQRKLNQTTKEFYAGTKMWSQVFGMSAACLFNPMIIPIIMIGYYLLHKCNAYQEKVFLAKQDKSNLKKRYTRKKLRNTLAFMALFSMAMEQGNQTRIAEDKSELDIKNRGNKVDLVYRLKIDRGWLDLDGLGYINFYVKESNGIYWPCSSDGYYCKTSKIEKEYYRVMVNDFLRYKHPAELFIQMERGNDYFPIASIELPVGEIGL